MYLYNKEENRIVELERKKFSQLNLTERNNLQEWIANAPNIFGEKLLIIQKEFDKFDGTNERLDLLALDKDGNIVVIENKLDDSGRDVTWQALKYASYCSTLSKSEIRDIFQTYLKSQSIDSDAADIMSDFYQQDYDDIVHLNQPQTQRVILVANKYRKEVTSTVLWLLNFKVKIECFKILPFVLGEQIFLTLEKIIPQRDSKDYVIKMAEKSQQELANKEGLQTRHHLRYEFWSKILPLLKGKTPVFQNIKPTKDHWLSSSVNGFTYTMVITKTNASVVFELKKSDQLLNKKAFDELFLLKDEIEKNFGQPLKWKRLDDKIASHISYTFDNVNIHNREDWNKIMNFLIVYIVKLHEAFKSIQLNSNN